MRAVVHPANVQDRDGARLLLDASLTTAFPRLSKVLADSAYRGQLVRDIQEQFEELRVEVVEHPDTGNGSVWVKKGQPLPEKPTGFRVLPKRWIVERTFAWFSLNRRLSKDYEANPKVSETWLWIAMAWVLIKRFAK